jgi:HlyD family secretion protein
MKLLRWMLFAALAAAVGLGAYWILKPPSPPEVDVVLAERGRLVSELATNGRTEPSAWSAVTSPREGRVAELFVEKGQAVAAGIPLLRIAQPDAESELAAAQARLDRARAALTPAEKGGRTAELAEIDGALARLKSDRAAAQRDEQTLDRLLEKNAATRAERDAARDRRTRLDVEIQSLESKRLLLVDPADRAAAQATLAEAEKSLAALRTRLDAAVLRAPRPGILYELAVRAGDWLPPGGVAARIGALEQLRVTVFVDEPELGGVALDQPVTVTWDALPKQEWSGRVQALPRQIVSLGSRQVGEVVTRLDNPDLRLPAGANVNARIRLKTIESAISIPKEALRREGEKYGVFLLQQGKLVWREVQTGAASVTRIEVLSGLKEGDPIALAGEETLRDGMAVRPASAKQ